MLIRALCDYYDILKDKGEVISDGYSRVNINYLVSLTADGHIANLIDWQTSETIGKKTRKIPKEIEIPKRTEKTGIDGNFIEFRSLYIFGLHIDKDTKELTAEYEKDKARKSHIEFVRKQTEVLSGLNSPVVNAFRHFVENWVPEAETQNESLLAIRNELEKSQFAFCLEGRPDILLHQDTGLLERWEEQWAEKRKNSEDIVSQCAVTGKRDVIPRLHANIKGVAGGQASGTKLVCFNNPAEESYGRTQSYNSSISEPAMQKYTQALNYLLSKPEHHTLIDEVTVIHWAMAPEKIYDELFDQFLVSLEDSEQMDQEETNQYLNSILKAAKNGVLGAQLNSEAINPDVDFFIVGIKPNAARLSIKFIYRNRFGMLLQNIAKHIEDTQAYSKAKPFALWELRRELVSPKATDKTGDKTDPTLITGLFNAIIYGTPYPMNLLAALVRRIRTDDITDLKSQRSSDIRMGMLKGCINREIWKNNIKEEIGLALNVENREPAYLCGRLFAVLENLQQRASNYSLNHTIKDAYFTSASARPALIFPKLLTLAQHHMEKLESSYYAQKEIGEIIDAMGDHFPAMLSLQDQGIFMLGYYQQMNEIENMKRKAKEDK